MRSQREVLCGGRAHAQPAGRARLPRRHGLVRPLLPALAWGKTVARTSHVGTMQPVVSQRRYCIRASLFVFNYELPEYVQANAGTLMLGIANASFAAWSLGRSDFSTPPATGNRFSEGGIPLNVSATLVWKSGARAFLECAFDRAPAQHLEVKLLLCCTVLLQSMARLCTYCMLHGRQHAPQLPALLRGYLVSSCLCARYLLGLQQPGHGCCKQF